MELTDKQKSELYDLIYNQINECVNSEYYKEYDLSKTNPKTPCLNANYVNGKIHGLLEMAESTLGDEALIKLHDTFKLQIEMFLQKANEIYEM